MTNQHYGQFCGLARAAEIVGQRWTLLILRDLSVGPRRYSDLVAGLPGIPTNTLASRLKELEDEGIVERAAPAGAERSVVYALTPRGQELGPALDALSRWGAGGMRTPREGEIVTTSSITAALRVAAGDGVVPSDWDTTYNVRVGDIETHVVMRDGRVTADPGLLEDPDLEIVAGPGIRNLLAGTLSPQDALATGVVQIQGDPALFERFAQALHVPYSANVAEPQPAASAAG
ncbi:helix-turn-helix transcriptional regulator [Microbacterium azadirachtae]|uniref:HTH-type transcriptional activator HxlR n=1 Tax=Microbacterium azadirachtae TaxID=582680 RepID=A0A0F0L8P0_9MICO|nr:helix-turn-helix domain-containing protein [Microbacterium azadirachtae]KJL29049.1 HTH-type transcriptional activator HxlR [Microbacterium azadirachtae]UXW86818.1 helix-turn-helix transcriptional regulator [Microbacterium azadirachtae]